MASAPSHVRIETLDADARLRSPYRGIVTTSEPILRCEWLDTCRLLCAVGNTRAKFAEIGADTFGKAAFTVVDSRHAFGEAGDLIGAAKADALPESKRAILGEVLTGRCVLPQEGLIIFKSVGMALQDLALAARYYELLGGRKDLASPANVASCRHHGGMIGAS